MPSNHEARIRQRLNQLAAATPSTEAINAAMARVRQKLMQTNTRPTARSASLWRIVMRSNLTKLAVAAVIVVAVVLIVRDGSMDVASRSFAASVEAMREKTWVYFIGTATRNQVNLTDEMWTSRSLQIAARRDHSGQITFSDYANRREFTYNPGPGTITVSYLNVGPAGYKEQQFTPPDQMLEGWTEDALAQGGAVHREENRAQYAGHTVHVYTATRPGVYNSKMFIDAESRLPVGGEMQAIDPNGRLKSVGTYAFDYPNTGPRDIYDLGVPRTARQVNNVPAPDYIEMYERYASRREAFSKYAAVVTHANASGAVDKVDVIYKDGRRERSEQHRVFARGNGISQKWPGYAAAMGTTFDSLLKWAQDDKSHGVSICLYNGKYDYNVSRDERGRWSEVSKRFSLGYHPGLDSLGWPGLSPSGTIVTNDYASQNGLLCVEWSEKAGVRPNREISPASKTLYYLNPGRDYICQKQEEYRPVKSPVSEGMAGGFDPNKIPTEPIIVREVTEYAQAASGLWYPRKTEVRTHGWERDGTGRPLELSEVIMVYLDGKTQVPQDVFDPDRLPQSKR
jgi:hypothetical protein